MVSGIAVSCRLCGPIPPLQDHNDSRGKGIHVYHGWPQRAYGERTAR